MQYWVFGMLLRYKWPANYLNQIKLIFFKSSNQNGIIPLLNVPIFCPLKWGYKRNIYLFWVLFGWQKNGQSTFGGGFIPRKHPAPMLLTEVWKAKGLIPWRILADWHLSWQSQSGLDLKSNSTNIRQKIWVSKY